MVAVFTIICIFLAVYFLFVRRIVDYSMLAFFSAVIYFLPGFFGYTSHHVQGVWKINPIHPEVYYIFITILASIFLFSLIGDSLGPTKRVRCFHSLPPCRGPGTEATVLLVIAIFAFTMLWLTTGSTLLFEYNKSVIMESMGRWHILFYSSAIVGFALACGSKRWIIAGIFLFLLLFNVYIGYRSPAAIALMAAGIVIFSNRGRLGKKDLVTLIPISLVFGFVMFFYKTVSFALRAGNWDLVMEKTLSIENYVMMITFSEPFVTQSILNEVVASGFQDSMSSIYSALYQLMIFAPAFGLEAISFNDSFQAKLFGDVGYGMASSIWAQMWSVGGWLLLIIMILVFNCIVLMGNMTLRSRNKLIAAGLSPIFCYWAFYIHRNDLAYILNLEKRVIIVLLFAIFVSGLLRLRAGAKDQ
jgi:hypothetical protein